MRITVQSQPTQVVHETLSPKTLHRKGLAERLPSNCEALSSNPSADKKNRKRRHKGSPCVWLDSLRPRSCSHSGTFVLCLAFVPSSVRQWPLW
jgi:hypothetical protein